MPFIVAGVDGSTTSFRALLHAVEQAELADAEVRAVTVVSYPVLGGYEYGSTDIQAMHDAAEGTMKTALDQLDEHFDGSVPTRVSTEVRTGHVGAELIRAAEADGGAAMVVAGSRGLGGFRSMMLGSVTTFLTHHMKCPLLIIPPSKDD